MASRYNNQQPTDLGVKNGKFKACPDTPNCVCTQASPSDKKHFAEPIPFSSTAKEAIEKMAAIIRTQKRTHIVTQTDTYLHAEFTIALFGFIDDVEYWADEATHLVHFRSASRMGKYDLEVNRNRMKKLRKKFEQ